MSCENFDKLPMGWATMALTVNFFSPQKFNFVDPVKFSSTKLKYYTVLTMITYVYEGFTCVYGEFIL